MQVAHSYQIDADIESGWYWQPEEGAELHGPYGTEQDAADSFGIDTHGQPFEYETQPLPALNPEVTA